MLHSDATFHSKLNTLIIHLTFYAADAKAQDLDNESGSCLVFRLLTASSLIIDFSVPSDRDEHEGIADR